MKKYVIDTVQEADYTAGSKARKDIRDILLQQGYESRNILIGSHKKRVVHEIQKIETQIPALFASMEENSIAVFQYPWPTLSFDIAKRLRKAADHKHIKMIALMHDLNSVRNVSALTHLYYQLFVQEISYLNCFDAVITHNDVMKKYLTDHGMVGNKIVTLNLFDYLGTPSNEHNGDFRILNIAGNLSCAKTKYIYEMEKMPFRNYICHLYGNGYEGRNGRRFVYEGAYPPEVLLQHLNHGFGLVWDGDSIDNCTGSFGQYLRINNPHKLSLYMACGIPVFIWDKAAEADFVRKNAVGYTIHSLNEIEGMMKNLTSAGYLNLLKNVSVIQNKVLHGFYTGEAVRHAYSIIQNR